MNTIIKSFKYDGDKVAFAWKDIGTGRSHKIEDDIAPTQDLNAELQKLVYVFPTDKTRTAVRGFTIGYKDDVVPVKITLEAVVENGFGEVVAKWTQPIEALDGTQEAADIIRPMLDAAVMQLVDMGAVKPDGCEMLRQGFKAAGVNVTFAPMAPREGDEEATP